MGEIYNIFRSVIFILAGQRLALTLMTDSSERAVLLYAVRLLAFLIILLAIFDRNRNRAKE